MQRYCMQPFENSEIHLDGKIFLCCSSWLKTPIGDYNSEDFKEHWNSPMAIEIRKSILDGSYKFCDKNLCPFLQNGTLKTYPFLSPEQQKIIDEKKVILDSPKSLMLNYDRSCNLTCESCRHKKISYSTDSIEFKSLEYLTQKFTEDFFKTSNEKEIRLNITGSGDPFGSQVFRQFLESVDGNLFPNLKIDLQTNGVLFNENQWNRLSKIHKNISQVIVSVDAANKDTYLLVRRGGNFEQLTANLDFLLNLRKQGYFDLLQVNLVVQERNFKEMISFAQKYLERQIDCIYFSLIDDWGSWKNGEYKDHAVWKSNHPHYAEFIKELVHPIFQNPRVNIGNLTQFREIALENELKNRHALIRMGTKFSRVTCHYARKTKDLILFLKKHYFQSR